MEEKIKQRCEEAGINPDVLTPSEVEELKREIEAEENGRVVLGGGVLNCKEVVLR